MTYTIHDIARILNVKEGIRSDDSIRQLLTDSRKLVHPATTVFFALHSTGRDGHAYIPELIERGVRNFVVQQHPHIEAPTHVSFLVVPDTLAALQALAAHHRARFRYTVAGITGSNGKTVVKEWLYQLLHSDLRIYRSPRSYNSQIGVPLSLWQMDEDGELGLFEAGISRTGEMEKLEKMIRPTIGVLTSFGEAHSDGFQDAEQKLQQKITLFRDCKTVVFKKNLVPASFGLEKKLRAANKDTLFFTWGMENDANLRVISITRQAEHTVIEGRYNEHGISIQIPFTDEASIENSITCWCVLLVLGMKPDRIAERMKKLQPVNMRLELKRGVNGCAIINDSYSNDLSSLGIALDFMSQQAADLRKTVILSDFLQTSMDESELFDQVWNGLLQHGVRRLVGIGPRIRSAFAGGRKDNGQIECIFFDHTESFLEQMRSSSFREECILVKGARVYEFEKIVQALELKSHQTVLEIDLNAIGHNLRQFRLRLSPRTKVMAMVKAFAYGSGGSEIGGILQYHKIDYLGVAYADEGVELRKSGITVPIMVMNPEEATFPQLTAYRLEPEIYSFPQLERWEKYLGDEGLRDYPVHIELETGMNRLGFATGEMDQLAQALAGGNSHVVSVFSHLASSESKDDDAFTKQQYLDFTAAARLLESRIGYGFLQHIANSAGAIRHPYAQLDMVRLGIGLYGIDQSGGGLDLHPVATLRSTIAQVKELKPGDTVSYNRRGKINHPSRIATVRIGYADGISRRLGHGRGKIWVRGELAPIVGAVCMDMIMVDITGIPGVVEGDDIIIFGKALPVEQVATWADTIPYEIMTGISQRVKRVYYME